MKIATFAVAAAAMLSTGCASVRFGDAGYTDLVLNRIDPHQPNISIGVDGPVIDQEPIILPAAKEGDRVTIKWALPAFSNLIFSSDSITIVPYPGNAKALAPAGLRCVQIDPDKRKTFECSYTKPEAGSRFKYIVRNIMEESKDGTRTVVRKFEELDPTIWN